MADPYHYGWIKGTTQSTIDSSSLTLSIIMACLFLYLRLLGVFITFAFLGLPQTTSFLPVTFIEDVEGQNVEE
jgi:hypothetical protein